MKQIACVIMDWAGTAVDYGCFAPLEAFLKAFKEEKDLDISLQQAREPMGLLKIDHIKAILSMDEVASQFKCKHGREWNNNDLADLYNNFETYLLSILHRYAEPIPQVIETLSQLRRGGVKIGSTTGYTNQMMEIVQPEAQKRGYCVDSLVTPEGLPAGRPAPYMIYTNMIRLAIPSVDLVVKVGDTISDIQEGVQAKVHSVGIIEGSNEMGVTLDEFLSMSAQEQKQRKGEVRVRMQNAGANYVLDSITELPACIEQINQKLNQTL